MEVKKKIVFISHDSTLTGAPILLLNLIRLIKETERYHLTIILVRGGLLEPEFKSLAELYILKPANYQKGRNFFTIVVSFLKYRLRLRKVIGKIRGASVVFNNTVANGKVLKSISTLGIPIVTYVHELESVIQEFNGGGHVDFSLAASKLIVVPSSAVAENLILNHQIIPDKVSSLNYYFPSITNYPARQHRNQFLKTHGIPEKKFYVGGMGTATHRKGIDLFLEVCKAVTSHRNEIGFIWIGGFEDGKSEETTTRRIKDWNLENNFFLTGKLPHSPDNLAAVDLFFLSSREDPYPLVVLEAAFLRIPAIYFSGTGGIDQFVETDAGWKIDKFDITATAMLIIELMNNKQEITRKGENAWRKVNKLHGDPQAIIDNFDAIIIKALKN